MKTFPIFLLSLGLTGGTIVLFQPGEQPTLALLFGLFIGVGLGLLYLESR